MPQKTFVKMPPPQFIFKRKNNSVCSWFEMAPVYFNDQINILSLYLEDISTFNSLQTSGIVYGIWQYPLKHEEIHRSRWGTPHSLSFGYFSTFTYSVQFTSQSKVHHTKCTTKYHEEPKSVIKGPVQFSYFIQEVKID